MQKLRFVSGFLVVSALAASIFTYRSSLDRGAVSIAELGPDCSITPPTNLKIENITGTSATLKWTKGTGGQYVKLWVSKKANPTADCIRLPVKTTDASCVANEGKDNDLKATPSTYQLNNLKKNTKYYWRLMMWAAEGCDAAAPIVSFTTTNANPSPSPQPSPSPSPAASPTPPASPQPSPSPSPAVSPSPTPPASPQPSPSPSPGLKGSQPDTGTPTWLTLFLISGIMVITVIKIRLKVSHA